MFGIIFHTLAQPALAPVAAVLLWSSFVIIGSGYLWVIIASSNRKK